jgi:hypothetical protein
MGDTGKIFQGRDTCDRPPESETGHLIAIRSSSSMGEFLQRIPGEGDLLLRLDILLIMQVGAQRIEENCRVF